MDNNTSNGLSIINNSSPSIVVVGVSFKVYATNDDIVCEECTSLDVSVCLSEMFVTRLLLLLNLLMCYAVMAKVVGTGFHSFDLLCQNVS